METNLWWQKAIQCLPIRENREEGSGRQVGAIAKGYKEAFDGDGYLHYCDCGDNLWVYTSQILLKCTL